VAERLRARLMRRRGELGRLRMQRPAFDLADRRSLAGRHAGRLGMAAPIAEEAVVEAR
jgi:hypothetical protein